MAESGVERTKRAASRPAPASLLSGPAVGRIALRTLVVAGFAGAAWLFSAAAAQAAEAQDAPGQPTTDTASLSAVSLPGAESAPASTGRREAATPAPSGSLTDDVRTAAKPVVGLTSNLLRPIVAGSDPASSVTLPSAVGRPGSAPAVSGQVRTTHPGQAPSGTMPNPISTTGPADRPAQTVRPDRTGTPAEPADVTGVGATGGSVPGTPAGTPTGASGLVGVVQSLVQPVGLGQAVTGPTTLLTPLTRVVDPVLDPLTSALRPVAGALQSAAAPVTAVLGSVIRPVTGVLTHSAGGPLVLPTTNVTNRRVAAVPAYAGPTRLSTLEGYRGVAAAVGDHTTSAERQPAVAEIAPGRVLVPAGASGPEDRPTPLRGYLGANPGVSTTGSGSHTDGGAFAVIPMSVAGSMVASHRLPTGTGVEIPRPVAEDSTFSPD